jgi:hypothetical protein
MKKVISVSVLLLLVFALCMGTMASAAEEPTVAVSSAENVTAGSEVTLTVSLANNPGIMAFVVTPVYDTNVFEFVGLSNAGGLTTGDWEIGTNAAWIGSGDVAFNGNLVTITLKVKDDVKPGDYSVSVADLGAGNYDEKSIDFAVTAGTVTVVCEHSLTQTEAKDATCTVDGNTAYWECSKCGKLFSDADATTETTEAAVTIAAKGHTTEVKDAKDPTCTEKGYTGDTVCTVCNETITKGTEIAAKGHSWGEGVQTKAPTCTETGVMTYTCAECGATKEDTIAANGHKTEVVGAKDATCTEKGYTGDTVCTVCEETIEKGTEIAANGHKTEVVGAKDPTCTEKGYTGDTVCAVCKETIKTGEETAANGHTWGAWETVTSPNCTDKGSEKRVCAVCQTVETKDVDANGHSWEDKYTVDQEPTCTENGSKSIHCAKCDVVKDSETLSALDHDWDEGKVTTAATCTETGVKTYTCNRKNCSVGTKTETIAIDENAHKLSKVEAKAATCTEKGNIEYYICAYCTEKFEDADATKALSDSAIEEPATGHTISLVEAKAATCEEEGNIAYYTCSSCKKNFTDEAGTTELTESVVISKLGHKWDAGVMTKEPTATTAGEMTWTCQVCSKTRVYEEPALGTSNSGSGDKTTGAANTKPQTGDETNIALWVVMMSVCAAGVVLTVSKKKTDK